jgi:hypothetical protein
LNSSSLTARFITGGKLPLSSGQKINNTGGASISALTQSIPDSSETLSWSDLKSTPETSSKLDECNPNNWSFSVNEAFRRENTGWFSAKFQMTKRDGESEAFEL